MVAPSIERSASAEGAVFGTAAVFGSGLRVLHLVDSLRVGGKERQAVELLKGLSGVRDVQLMVVTMGSEQFYVPDILNLGIPLVYLIRKVRWDPFIFLKLYRVFREFKPEVVHTNSDMATFYAWPLTRLFKARLVNGTIRNAFQERGFRWAMHRLLLRISDVRIANSRAGFKSRGLEENASGNQVVYNGFDAGRVQSNAENAGLPGVDTEGKKIVGMVAEFSGYKDYPTFLKAAVALTAKRNDVIFVAIGSGDQLEACKRLVPRTCSSIYFLGERKEVESLVQVIDVGVLCTFTEGISNALMEFMAAAKPVVSTDGGGTSELVLNGKTGFLVPPSDFEAVAEKIEALLDDPVAAAEMGRLGRERLLCQFSMKGLVENTLRAYSDAVNQRRSSKPAELEKATLLS